MSTLGKRKRDSECKFTILLDEASDIHGQTDTYYLSLPELNGIDTECMICDDNAISTSKNVYPKRRFIQCVRYFPYQEDAYVIHCILICSNDCNTKFNSDEQKYIDKRLFRE